MNSDGLTWHFLPMKHPKQPRKSPELFIKTPGLMCSCQGLRCAPQRIVQIEDHTSKASTAQGGGHGDFFHSSQGMIWCLAVLLPLDYETELQKENDNKTKKRGLDVKRAEGWKLQQYHIYVHPRSLTARPCKMVVGRRFFPIGAR